VEGPIIIIITGFLVFLGFLNVYVAYFVLVLADIIGDSLYYSIGKYGAQVAWIKKLGSFIGYGEKSEKYIEDHFIKHKGKTLLLSKISHGIGGTVQVAAGVAKVPYLEFLLYSFLGTAPKVLILFLIGYYAGSSYEKIDKYFDTFAIFILGIVILFLASYLIFSKYAKRYLTKE
jgi:membrane protein DedA with SNARE-associated domain